MLDDSMNTKSSIVFSSCLVLTNNSNILYTFLLYLPGTNESVEWHVARSGAEPRPWIMSEILIRQSIPFLTSTFHPNSFTV